MADKLWEVSGTFVRNGAKREFNNVYSGKNADAAKSAAMKDYNTHVRAGYEKKVSYGKLSITKVEEWTKERARAFAKSKGF
ncbi:hypothetical protein SEA_STARPLATINUM_129 [Streptomyces phage StarPlatinum]|uniref:Uncharacterized protein n=1 Tax=Streptomyces phage StarPlatinum TaxID=2283265 RepID=A0A345M8P7_9CAUD|nr:hypothetical protein HWB77_gp169 [Streptomyces phage StarPlatinum]AXH66868.1 hypothetical protein SEA_STARPLATINUM_129 [Streptomyces phage StarPlatinum]